MESDLNEEKPKKIDKTVLILLAIIVIAISIFIKFATPVQVVRGENSEFLIKTEIKEDGIDINSAVDGLTGNFYTNYDLSDNVSIQVIEDMKPSEYVAIIRDKAAKYILDDGDGRFQGEKVFFMITGSPTARNHLYIYESDNKTIILNISTEPPFEDDPESFVEYFVVN